MDEARGLTMLHRHPQSLLGLPGILLFACVELEQPIGDYPAAGSGGSAGSSNGTAGASAGIGGTVTGGTGGSSSGMGGYGNAPSTGGTGNETSTGGLGNAPSTGGSENAPSTGGVGNAPNAGTGNETSTGGSGNAASTGGFGNETSAGGSGNAPSTGGSAGSAGSAGTGPSCEGAFCPRTGSFKVLAYFNTQGGFTHTQAINNGRTMLMNMATKQGFEVTFSDNPADLGATNLEQYELLFGLNPTGTSLQPAARAAERAAVEEWMTMKNGAFAGVHSSTDFMPNWAFWKEVTGQYFDNHDICCSQQNIQWEPTAASHITVAGLPSPWPRSEEWYKFKSWDQWSAKPGFQVLSKVTTNTDGGTRPVSYIREWSGFRSFYTSLGHEGPTYQDPNFIKHVSAGVMWAVRREALFKP
jgi:type 1 glutamine amidotransferase